MKTKTKTKDKKAKSAAVKQAPDLPNNTEALLGKAQICFAVGVSVRTLQSMLASGEFPKPDTHIGKFPRWRVATFNTWVLRQCGAPEN